MQFKLISQRGDIRLDSYHLIGLRSSLATWRAMPELAAIGGVLGELAESQGTVTLEYGLQGCCRRLTLLDANQDDLVAGNLTALLKDVRAIEPREVPRLVFFTQGLDLQHASVRSVMQRILLSLANLDYELGDLGYKSEPRTGEDTHLELWVDECHLDIMALLLRQVKAIHRGMQLARQWADRPAADSTPALIANFVRDFCQQQPALDCEIFDQQQIKVLNMGALSAVGKGSIHPPRLVVAHYRGRSGDLAADVVLVGKGVTFDSGGLWLKGGEGMRTMKYDMCGAAALLGLLQTLNDLQLALNVDVVLALAENMPGADAMRPGDVVSTHAGHRVEIINTDAEGRLVLADALSYGASLGNQPLLIDVATLTGAAVKALGYDISALMGNHQRMLDAFCRAGDVSGDRVWPLPLDDSFAPQIKSAIADLCNTPPNNAAIAVSAGYFLSQFVGQCRWIHLDVSGTALSRGDTIQASGRPIPLLVEFLCRLVECKNNGEGNEKDSVGL